MDDERKAVVCELIRTADERLTAIAEGLGSRATAAEVQRRRTTAQPFGRGTEPI